MIKQIFSPKKCLHIGNSNRYLQRKEYIEPLVAILLLVPALPVIGLVVVAVRLTSRGPGIFKQVRTGKNGKTFTMYKIRTMIASAEDGLGAVWSQKGDPRVTAVGRFARSLHLDELPQLLNVAKGEMTLVGPRPERPEIADMLAEEIDQYDCRHLIKPGITGLAQINLPPDSDLASVRKKLWFDLNYIKTANWWLDLRILAATAVRIFGLSGGWRAKLLGLHRTIPIDQLDGDESGAERNGKNTDHFVRFDDVIDQHAEIEPQTVDDGRWSDMECPSTIASNGSNGKQKPTQKVFAGAKTKRENMRASLQAGSSKPKPR